MALRLLKPQEPQLRCRGPGQLCLPEFAAAQQQGWDGDFPLSPQPQREGGTHSHLQLSKEAPTACPGLGVPPQQHRGTDTLAPWKQQEMNTRQVNKKLLGRGSSVSATAPRSCSPAVQPRMVRMCPECCFPKEGAPGTRLLLTLILGTSSGHHLVTVLALKEVTRPPEQPGSPKPEEN